MSDKINISIILLSFFLSALSTAIISKLGTRLALIDNPNERSSHSFPTPRGGGIGIWLAFMIIEFFVVKDTFFTLIAGAAGLLGLLEDYLTLSSKLRLLIQFVISISFVFLFLGLPTSTVSIVSFLFWLVFITGTANFYNFMDGINGIAGLTGIVGFGLMAFFSFFIINEPDIALISIALSSACLGFLPFNFPKARVFMGDIGSVFLGFVFASFVLKLSANIGIFLCLGMFLSTFYADAILTMYYRYQRGEYLMKAHRSHLYQYMSNELKIPHWIISSIYALTQGIFGISAIVTYRKGLLWQSVLLGTFVGLFIITYQIIKRIKPRLPGSPSKVL